MNKIIVFVALLVAGASCQTQTVEPPVSPAAERPTSETAEQPALLVMVNRCATELYPKSVGSGGNALRYDSLSLKPYGLGLEGGLYELPEPTTWRWLVRIEEEHPHTKPSGVEFTVNLNTGDCGASHME